MNTNRHTRIVASGSYLPEREVKNEDLTAFPAISLPLIEKKTGVKSRRHAAASECTSDLATKAALSCLEKAQFEPGSLDTIILATSSPDRLQPATATKVQFEIGASNAYAFDINSVCSGGVYGIQLADALIRSGSASRILLIAAEVYSKFLNKKDFSTYPYFGDGAAALLFTASSKPGICRTILKSDGSGADVIQIPAGGSMRPLINVEKERECYFSMDGRKVFEFAVSAGTEVVRELMVSEGMNIDEVDYIVAHQANINILKEFSSRLGIGMDKFFINLDKYGNTAAASPLIAFDELYPSLREGDKVIIVAFGGGLSWGASLVTI